MPAYQRRLHKTEWRLGTLPWPFSLVWKAGGLPAYMGTLTFHTPLPVARLSGEIHPVLTWSGELPIQGSRHVQHVAVVTLEAPNCWSTGLRLEPG